VSSYSSSASGRKEPISDLTRLLADEGLSPDYILCAGDIADKSNPASLSFVWARITQLAQDMGKPLVTTVGNHDLDSRYKENKWDPRGYVMALEPPIPYNSRKAYLEYWAENFTFISDDHCNIVSLNTAAFHGGGLEVEKELEHGRVSDATLAKLDAAIQSIDERPINIMLCHHHLIKSDISDNHLTGQTRGGERLIQTLERTRRPWIVVHGHKHVPDIFYGHGGNNAPVVLGCASFSAQVGTDAQNRNPNQVHLLRCDPNASSLNLDIAGDVLSWTWQPGIGWKRSQGDVGLPYMAGFGYRGSVIALADQLNNALIAKTEPHMAWPDVVQAVPQLERILPNDFSAFERELSVRKLALLRERGGAPAQIGRSSQ
jgi:predicted phosphodiesterase